MSNPVIQALAEARLKENDAMLAEAVRAKLDYVPAVASQEEARQQAAAFASFAKWCDLRGVRAFPANPTTLAAFALESVTALGPDEVASAVAHIADAHVARGLANPAATPIVNVALGCLRPIEQPRSWPKGHKARFLELPFDLQAYVVAREAEREKVVRRAMSESSELRRKLKQEEPDAKTKAAA